MTNIIKPNYPKCIFFDVDGILTDGSKIYSSDKNAKVIGKRFNDIDFTAFKILKCFDIDFYWISGDASVNKELANNRSIKFIYTRESGVMQKKSFFMKKICKDLNYNKNDIWFMGDDLFDLSAIQFSSFSLCPSNSPQIIRDNVSLVIPRKSGEYLVSWLVDFIISEFNLECPSEETVASKENEENQTY